MLLIDYKKICEEKGRVWIFPNSITVRSAYDSCIELKGSQCILEYHVRLEEHFLRI